MQATFNNWQTFGSTTTVTGISHLPKSEYEPLILLTSDTGTFGSNPFVASNDALNNSVPRHKRLSIRGHPIFFKWTCPKAEQHEKFITSSLTSSSALSVLCQSSGSNQQLAGFYGVVPDYFELPSASATNAGAWAIKVEAKGGIVYDCLDNIEYADQTT